MGEVKHEDLHERAFAAAMEGFKRRTDRMAEVAMPVIREVYEKEGAVYENIAVPITDGKRVYNITCNLKECVETECKSMVKAFEKSILLHIIDDEWKENLRELDESEAFRGRSQLRAERPARYLQTGECAALRPDDWQNL